MRLFLAVLCAAAAIFTIDHAAAQEARPSDYPYCSVTSGIGTSCWFENLARQQNVEGKGGWCQTTGTLQERPDSYYTVGHGPQPQGPNE